jgi:hypothetical protein
MPWLDVLPGRVFGGFEGSTMRFADGRRVDCLSDSRHDVLFARDYDLLSKPASSACAKACAGIACSHALENSGRRR